ncbi:DUF302 domain-containing protein [Grimontia hollisae]|uniref:Camphor resistance protein CrcB n=2 Tax=Grimontia hollisae TaxID=673 RepID=A0A377J839_GRIHO|nr:DUF302 domain-containing protein [Grimontia hollisae]AMG29277.1 DUF302 domain-containing protein [Grimontia hollisae]EEY73101.1 putative inner membrane or exported protein [Grimontia hollisae CIP 101886]MDF2185174.1 DUF302 domain-containing protein [Grimontia hollisae]STO77803.1 camphor resistance protein CrcB [Grimontia hollisae]STO98672.1 camphor resistance protein CrcB [Grimontia hollisae]
MKKLAVATIASLLSVSVAKAEEGLIQIQSANSVAETASKVEMFLKEKGLTQFARIDHAANAEKAGLTLRPTEVIIFGNPKVGTPLMQCAQSIAIDLPQKMLISQDADNNVWLAYNDPVYLRDRHNMEGCENVLNKVSKVLAAMGKTATN